MKNIYVKIIVIVIICLFFGMNNTQIIKISKGQPSLNLKNTTEMQSKYYPIDTLYRVTPALNSDDLPKQAELVGGQPGLYHDIFMNKESKYILEKKGYHIEELEQMNTIIPQMIVNQYHTFNSIESILQTIALEYDNITNLFSIGKSYEDRDIWCLEISDNPGVNEEEPGILFLGLHHAREWPTIAICLQLAETLTDNYYSDEHIQDLVDARRIWIIPCVNPDGYVYDHDEHQGEESWRKNRHYLKTYDLYGIDLNRNYGGSTNGDPYGMWGSLGMSHYPSSELYCGENQFSELETQAIKQFFISHDICACISWHTYSELVMWPWGYSGDIQTPHSEYIAQVGTKIASLITKQNGDGTYTPTQAAGLYPTSGDMVDWMYGYSHYIRGKPCFAYTIEACKSFHPVQSTLDQVCKENVEGAMVLIEEATKINELQPLVLPPIISDISENKDQTYTINWNIPNPASNPIKYEVQELSEVGIYKDTVEDFSGYLILDGFMRSTDRSYSSSQSYHAHNKDNTISSMTTAYPLFVDKSMELSFYCWYEIEEDWDKAFVEISTDGRNYQVIDTFTGFSDGWILRQYSLDTYLGKSIFIRFRYSTDKNTLEEGFYIDDIYPIVNYQIISLLNDNIDTLNYTISEKQDDQYFYKVRGYNQEFGWGDFSMLKPLKGILINNTPPNKPIINGPQRGKPGNLCTYEIQTTDPEENEIYYYISWGDETKENWIGPFRSGQKHTINHTWKKEGNYIIELRAKDNLEAKSEWTTLKVIIPKYKSIYNNSLFQQFIEDNQYLVHFLRQVFNLGV